MFVYMRVMLHVNPDLLTLTIQVLSIILDTVTICHQLFKCNLLEEHLVCWNLTYTVVIQ